MIDLGALYSQWNILLDARKYQVDDSTSEGTQQPSISLVVSRTRKKFQPYPMTRPYQVPRSALDK